MQYRLKKDLPWAKAGTIWEETFLGDIPEAHTMESDGMTFLFPSRTFSDWFEEVDERWKPERDQEYFFLDEAFEECMSDWQGDNIDRKRYRGRNVFKTEELSQRAAEQIKALLKEFHKNNS